MTDDTELLRRYARDHEEAAFAELVRRHVGLVYAAALRRANGDPHRAADATQLVFAALARHAASLTGHTVLAGWLYTATRNATLNLLRQEARRQIREQEAFTMHELFSGTEPEADWRRLRPVLDAAMDELDERDREALLVRFFQGRSLADVAATLRVSEEAARKRVDRALDKLRGTLRRRGIVSTAAALGVALASQPAVTVPVAVAETLVGASLAGAAAAGGAVTIFSLMNALKLIGSLALGGIVGGAVIYETMQTRQQTRESAAAAQSNTALATSRADNQRLGAEIERLRTVATTPPPPDPLAELRALVIAEQQKIIQPLTTLLRVSRGGALQPLVVLLFNLTPTEKTGLEKALATMREQLNALDAAHVAGTERPSDNEFVVKFQTYAAEGGKVHDQLLGTLDQTLGAERKAALLTLIGDRFGVSVGGGFGAVERSLRFQRRTMGAGERMSTIYTAIDRTEVQPGTVLSASTTTSNVTQFGSREALLSGLPALAAIIPADF